MVRWNQAIVGAEAAVADVGVAVVEVGNGESRWRGGMWKRGFRREMKRLGKKARMNSERKRKWDGNGDEVEEMFLDV